MLTPQEAFRVGFLMRCADEALTPAQAHERVKQAEEMCKHAGAWGDTLRAAGPLASTGVMGAIMAPAAVGSLAGLLAHKAVEDDVDADDVRRREIIAELKHWARRAKTHKKHKDTLSA